MEGAGPGVRVNRTRDSETDRRSTRDPVLPHRCETVTPRYRPDNRKMRVDGGSKGSPSSTFGGLGRVTVGVSTFETLDSVSKERWIQFSVGN